MRPSSSGRGDVGVIPRDGLNSICRTYTTIFHIFVFVAVGMKYDFFPTCTNFIIFSVIIHFINGA